MDQRLSLKLGQKLILTPTLQQAIKLLQLSKLELVQHIRQELESNPILDEVLPESSLSVREEAESGERAESPSEAPMALGDELEWNPDGLRGQIDYSHEEDDNKDAPWYENTISAPQSIQDYLSWQLHLTLDDDDLLVIGEEIIGNIDDDGYLRADITEIARLLNVTVEKASRVLDVVQGFDPPGVGARDVEECLILQLRRLPGSTLMAEAIVRNHLKNMEGKKYLTISQALRRPIEEVYAAAALIKGLEPKPGRLFAHEPPQYIIPDLSVYKEGDEYRIVLNDEGLPKLRISAYYRQLMKDAELPSTTRDYLQKKFSSALWLVKSIHQRQRTILRVAQSILKFQREFFDRGIGHLKPLILRDVAEDIGVHESTVSRVTTHKYAQTPHGLLELKFFFNTGIESFTGGESVASASVQNIIRELVAAENPSRPLSDAQLAVILKSQHGLVIARRTVAKYRLILKIPSTSQRRKSPAGKLTPSQKRRTASNAPDHPRQEY